MGPRPPGGRQKDRNRCALVWAAGDRDPAVVLLDNFFHRCEAQARAASFGGEIGLKHLPDKFRGNGRSVIFDENFHFLVSPGTVHGKLNFQMPTWGHRFQRIRENAEKHQLHLPIIAPNLSEVIWVLFAHGDSTSLQVCRDEG